MGDYEGWTACSHSCGTGYETNKRVITTQASYDGANCPTSLEIRQCNAHPCPINCQLSEYGGWGDCSRTCGGGQMVKHRSINRHSAFGGVVCPNSLTLIKECKTNPCPVDCVYSSFPLVWSACTSSCNSGNQFRTRTVTTHPASGGVPCPHLREDRVCNSHSCPANCIMSDWTAWATCSDPSPCTRTRQPSELEKFGGAKCSTVVTDSKTCNCPVDCVLSQWSDYAACSVTCGTGVETKSRSVVSQAAGGGWSCNGQPLTQHLQCQRGACPKFCTVSNWTAWTPCTKSCGFGSHQKTRSIVEVSMPEAGFMCPALTESKECNEQQCPTNCVMSSWQVSATCSQSCGGGTKSYTRTEMSPATFGGLCGSLTKTVACNSHECPVDCVAGTFDNWSTCSKTCGGGMMRRTKPVLVAAAFGGQQCLDRYEALTCNPGRCGCSHVHCTWMLHERHNKYSVRVWHDGRELYGDQHMCALTKTPAGTVDGCHCDCSFKNLSSKQTFTNQHLTWDASGVPHLVAGAAAPGGDAHYWYKGSHADIGLANGAPGMSHGDRVSSMTVVHSAATAP
jgi:hypothetical protein